MMVASTTPHRTRGQTSTAAVRETGDRRWLLFVHQLPSHPSNLRVSTWRRLQQLGAMPLKQAVYVLPDTPNTREDFEWLKTEVTAVGGEATVFASADLDARSEDALVEDFRRARQEAYSVLAGDVEETLESIAGGGRRRKRALPIWRLLTTFRERLTQIERVDFFGSAGRDRVTRLLDQLDAQRPSDKVKKPASAGADGVDREQYRGRLWVTRPRPGVDRMSSAWLIRRFIDPQARFGFAANRETASASAVPFDMFGVDFSHQGEGCTFETLCSAFGIGGPAISRIAAIVHDLDLKDGRFGAPECNTVGAMIEGLQLAHHDDAALLEQGMTLFDSLFRSFERSTQTSGPRVVAKRVRRAGAAAGKRRRRTKRD
jgi:hypothetical protein